MAWSRRIMWIGMVAVACLGAGAAHAAPIVLPRPGQIGFGVQGGYGTLLDGGSVGELFGAGNTFAVRVRYRMRYERGVGISFEGQRFDARDESPDSTLAPKRLTLIMSGVEIYQMFGTRTQTTRMLSAGFGLAQASAKLADDETAFPEDGVYLSAGGDVEHFVYRSWAVDLSGRYMAVFQKQKVNHDLQIHAGLIFYASY